MPDAPFRASGAAPIVLLAATPTVSADELRARFAGEIVACDCYVRGAEHGERVAGGYRLGRVLNVDHHAPGPVMARAVSSANLALAYIAAHGRASRDATVVVTHTDCDSVLSAGLMAGVLEPRAAYGEAALAADHTGEANDIADLLQALDARRDLALSFGSLRALEAGEPLPEVAAAALARRRTERAAAARAVRDGVMRWRGALAFGVFAEPPDTEFFPALLPAAAVILLAAPHPDHPGRWIAKLRLGRAASPALTLHALAIEAFDANYGGRWNAGANRRAGGTALEPEAYAEQVAARMAAVLGAA